jgi:hypothetical protein
MTNNDELLRKLLDPSLEIKKQIDVLLEHVRATSGKSLDEVGDELEKVFRETAFCRILWLATNEGATREALKTFFSETKLSLVYYRFIDSLKSIDDSFLLAISGRYLAAGSALRTALESMVTGAFIYGLQNSSTRATLSNEWNQKPIRGSTKRWIDFFDDVSANPVAARDSTAFEIALETTLIDECANFPDCEGPKPLPFAWMFNQLTNWGFMGGVAGMEDFIYKNLYKTLCKYVHAARNVMSYTRSVLQSVPFLIYSGEVHSDTFSRYSNLANIALNAIGSIFFEVSREIFTAIDSKEYILEVLNNHNNLAQELSPIFNTILDILS